MLQVIFRKHDLDQRAEIVRKNQQQPGLHSQCWGKCRCAQPYKKKWQDCVDWSDQLKQHWSKLWMGGWLQFVLHKLEAKGAFLHVSRYIWKLHWDTLEWRVERLESESKLNVRMQLHVQSLGTTSWQVIWCLRFNWKQPRKLYSVKLVAWIFFPFVGPRLKVKVEKLGARKAISKPKRYFIDEFIKVSRSS